ncbi:MAG: DUF748 domain-containing protein, partial [Candidatus Margulisiibacteriota bacterium]
MIKKYAIILILPLMVPFLSGFSFSQFTDPLYENVKQQAVQSFSDLFSNKVEIGSAGGRLIGQIILNDVKIGNDIKAKKIVINFSPIKYAMAKGDVVPAITSIKVFNGNANIVRGKKGDINAVHFLKPAKPGGGGIPFKANLFLYDCQAEYRDEAGLPYRLKDSLFKMQFENIHGGVDLSRAPQISIDLKASSGKNSIFIKGKANPDKNSFDIRLISKDMDMGSWAPYLLPFIDIHKGTGDLVFNLKNNDINMQLSGKADDVPFTVSGRLFDRLDLNIDVKDADLLKLKNIYPGTSALDLKGRGGLGLHLFGPYNDFKAEIKAKIGAGEIYGQKISGAVSAVYYKKKAAIEAAKISAYDGNILISGEVDFSSKVPHFKLTGNLDSLDLKKLSDGSPVISGRLSGRMEAGGTFDALYGEYNGKFLHASVMGQPIDFGQLKFRYGEGKFSIDSLSLTSLTAGFHGSGDILKDRNVSFSGSASGINLAGEGSLGGMSAKLDSFRGAVSFKFDDAFIKSPLKNLNASGTLEISSAKIGEQTIDRAIGGIELAQGRMKILNASISSGRSTILISGETGVGVPTDLKISGNALQFDDFKIFNSILPQEINNPTGSIDLDLKIYGTLNKIESADDFLGLNARGSLRTRNGSLGGIYFKEALLEASLENKELNINKIKLATTNSEITGRYLAANGSIEANLAGWFDLDDFSQVLKRIGMFKGTG